MEDGVGGVALCIEGLGIDVCPVDVVRIAFPGEHVIDFVVARQGELSLLIH